ncbi:MAG: type II secretion system F family protein [Candidatus Aminicenantes bacterium]|nr:type II secretion system F family protein [Candidatus Aminicenantes bacterium]
MPTFVWKGKNRYGDAVGGERVARNIDDLRTILQQEQIAVSNITRKRAEFKIPFLTRERVTLKELAVFSRHLSVLIDAELPLIQSLNILAEEQEKNKYFRSVIKSIRADVEAGSSLNHAMRKYPKVFDDLYCNLVGTGEQSGSLDVMLTRLADYEERIVKLRSQVKQAMIYPVAIVSFALVVTIFMLWKVVPTFANIFMELGAKLPLLTVILVKLSDFVSKYILFIFLGIIALIVGYRFFGKTTKGRYILDRVYLKMPLFGKILEKVSLSRITRTLSTLLSGGVAMLESLKITAGTAGNVIIQSSILDARRKVSEGQSLTDSFREAGDFPFMLTQMIGVGEATGTLDEMLSKLADFYDEEVETSVSGLLSMLEPIMMIFVGGLVGTIVISMYLPIFSMIQQI